jgi:hypothetical protein
MSFIKRAMHLASLVGLTFSGLAMAVPAAAGPASSTAAAAAVPAGAPAAASGSVNGKAGAGAGAAAAATSLPVVAEHKYRMLARVRPMLFWINVDDVGGAKVSLRGDQEDASAYGIELLIGSDPQRAPRQINKWGYIAEEVRGNDARIIGVMKQSNEQSVAEAEKQLNAGAQQGGYVFRTIQGTATAREARAGVTSVRVPTDLTYRDIASLLSMVGGNGKANADAPENRAVALPNGTRPGFLVALRELVNRSVDAYRQQPSAKSLSDAACKTPVPYVYFGKFYDLQLRGSQLLPTATIDGKSYQKVARSDFEIRNRSNGETTRFQLTYGTNGALAGIPVHGVFQPRWFLEIQLFLDERTSF